MKIVLLLVLTTLLTGTVFADSFDDRLRQLAEDSGKEYVRPLVTAFGTNLNSGLYNTAAVLKPSIIRPVRVGVGFHTMMAMVPSGDKEFEFYWDPGEGYEPITGKTATVFGDDGWSYEGDQIFPDGLDISLVPLFVPQFRFGLPKGNEIMVRYLPPVGMGDFGDLEFWGLGAKHSIDQYIPLFPVDLSLQGAYQMFSVGELVEISSLAVNAQVSRSLLMLTVYGGLGWEDTKLEAKYDYTCPVTDEEERVEFDIKGDNQFRLTAGFRWAIIPFVHINADYTLSQYQALSLGLGAQF